MKQKKIPVYFFYTESMFGRISSLIKLLVEKHYNAVIVHHEGIGIYTFYLILTYLFKNIRFIKYLHCSFEDKYFYQGNKLRDWLNYKILKKTLNRSEHLIAVSEFVKRSYCSEFGCKEAKVSVIYNGIRLTKDVKYTSSKVQSGEICLLYIGRLIEVKGVRQLLHAVEKLKNRRKIVELDIVGEGPQREELEWLSKELGLESNVHFHGQQLNKQDFYDKADIFVYPSIWQEAFGISIVEAMEQGKLCVASCSGGIPEIIEDKKEGLLCKSDDVGSLTEMLDKAIDLCRTEAYTVLTCAARRKARQFDIEKMIEKLQEVCS